MTLLISLNLKNFISFSGAFVLARVGSRFFRGIQTKHTEDTVAVFFKEPSPQFHQLYHKQNVNQIVDDTPVNISQLSPDARVLIEFEMGFAALGTAMGEYVYENINNNSSTINNSSSVSSNNNNNSSISSSNNNNSSTINNSSSNKNQNNARRLVNFTIRLDESGDDISDVASTTIWLLPVQMKDKGDRTILQFQVGKILRVV